MKIADLYIRVSTDEQADKGYSQRGQEELLRRYCEINKITIRMIIFEDHSAKTFNRPEWKKYLLELKKHKGKTDLVLFLKWDRFSRNAGDAYQMINTLRKLGVEPQAIEQPLDLSIPENKMMLAFYLAAPEVENDRRALNVITGMRRARKEGRYMGLAPVGYKNRTDDNGRKYIAPYEPQAGIMRWAFDEIAKGLYNTEQVYKLARQKGFKGTKSLFWFAIRNPVYCGKIFLPKYRDEESRLLKASHEPLITEDLYYQVQDVLDGRKRSPYKLKVASVTSLPLRGFLVCPECGKILTGSISRGRSNTYAYYHCFMGCRFRHRAEGVNDQFLQELRKYIPRSEMTTLYKIIIQEAWQSQTAHLQDDRKQLLIQIKDIESKLAYIRDLLASRQIEPEDFRIMKSDYTAALEKLEVKLNAQKDDQINIADLLNQGIDKLLKIDCAYETGTIEEKRQIIGSMFPEKFNFEKNSLRTGRVNEAARLIYQINNELSGNKKGQNGNKSILSCQVGMRGFEPPTSSTPCWRDTGLRYIPKGVQIYRLE
ncbi:recombinase family protein [Mucilaginibacter defluvii]|uniref:Recombinase family protein n=1 Tax=Mucilaginibacter defluvii TaxID=1196019 RepID=A0ABP9GA50_9SPHI